jgi:hypothetical protein
MNRILGQLKKRFEVTIGGPHCFIGLELRQKNQKIMISQKGYLRRILQKFNMTNCKRDTALILTMEISPESQENKEIMKQVPYRQAVGSLMFAATCTRPDILFEVCKCTQFCEKPGHQHWNRVKRIMKYLNNRSRAEYFLLCLL